MSFLEAFILGIVEGITEFIPISSTGHLILAGWFMGLSADMGHGVFEVFIQIGAILAVVLYYLQRVFSLVRGVFIGGADRALAFKIIIAFFPAAVLGVLLHGFIKGVLFTPIVVAVALIVGGGIMLLVERAAPSARAVHMVDISWKQAFQIGLCQMMALIPGVSRAGASIVGAQFFGVGRLAATEFSFFLAIPTILGAAVFDVYQNRNILNLLDFWAFAVGTGSAFFSAFIVIRFFISYVARRGFAPFAYYRIFAGIVMLALIYWKGV